MLGPIRVGATTPAFTFEVRYDDNRPFPITGAAFAGWMHEGAINKLVTLDPARFSETDGARGIFTYSPAAADVATPGTWKALVRITIAGDVAYVEEDLVILPLFPGVS